MSQHLAPNLKSKPGPEYLSWNSFFGAKHVEKGFIINAIQLRSLYVHARPSLRQS
jgi:hypothetical protein